MVREAPLGQNRAAARNDSGDAIGRQRNVAQKHAGVDGEVVHALFGLFDQRVAEQLPRQILGLAADLLERLVDRNGADRHRGVTQNPLARLVNVLAGREIHHRVGAPARRPRHLLDFFVDGRTDRGVADVSVDLHQEAAPDDHRLALGMVDVVWQDGTAARNLVAHERRLDVLANRDELHLRRYLAAARVMHLRHVGAGLCAARTTRLREAQRLEFGHRVAAAAIDRRGLFERYRIGAPIDPRTSQGRQAVAKIERRRVVGVRTAGVVERVHRSIGQRHGAPRYAD